MVAEERPPGRDLVCGEDTRLYWAHSLTHARTHARARARARGYNFVCFLHTVLSHFDLHCSSLFGSCTVCMGAWKYCLDKRYFSGRYLRGILLCVFLSSSVFWSNCQWPYFQSLRQTVNNVNINSLTSLIIQVAAHSMKARWQMV
jgi:hypothetical protein